MNHAQDSPQAVIRNICQRLSLRPPQEKSLRILDHVIKLMDESQNAEQLLTSIEAAYPSVTSFERDFPSLCFALATGVGKTRLMGAFISYLYHIKNIRTFFIVAPNITIYKKLITDFTPGTAKYVFKGINVLEQGPPQIITGDNYESLQGVRGSMLDRMYQRDLHINIFNIAKITAKDNKGSKLAKDDTKRNEPRIRRLSEYIGQSYFEYLCSIPDLVVLMDESHRYRADAGMAAINELKPYLGLELTATPQVEKSNKSIAFNNSIYFYGLAQAIQDGFVKNPAVVTRRDFISSNYNTEQIETIKLEDGIHTHEDVRTALSLYAASTGMPVVKPFMLVVAQDTEHANALQELMESESFFGGRYRGKIITVHSKNTGKGKGKGEDDDIVEKLLTVEDAENPVEVVIHVNMLKEGWDVTNLYTIVPLRAANSRTLVEQSIGRGLRLPFGRRTGVAAVDRLNIICHDRFQEIIDYANDPNSIIRKALYMDEDIPTGRNKAVSVPSILESLLKPNTEQDTQLNPQDEATSIALASAQREQSPIARARQEMAQSLNTEARLQVAQKAFESIQRLESLKSSSELQRDDIQKRIVREIQAAIPVQQGTLIAEQDTDIAAIVAVTTKFYQELQIDIPRIIVVPQSETEGWYEEFDLDCSSINVQPVAQEILIRYLQGGEQAEIAGGTGIAREDRPEDYLVKALVGYDDVDYDKHTDLLYKLAKQLLLHIRSYLHDETDVENVLLYHQYRLAEIVHSQMQKYFRQGETSYEAQISRGFVTLKTATYGVGQGQRLRPLRNSLRKVFGALTVVNATKNQE